MGSRYEELDLLSFQARFPDEASCRRYLETKRWPDGFACPRCGHREAYWHRTRQLFQCKACHYQASVTAGTVFHKTRIPLQKWFWMLFLLSRDKHGVSMKGLQRLLGIGSYQTVWTMAHKLRRAMAARDARYQLAGLVEVDDTYFGGKKKPGKRGRGAKGKSPVVVAVEERDGGARFAAMQVVERLDGTRIGAFVTHTVAPGAQLKTDGLHSYVPLSQEEDYDHRPVVVGTPENASAMLPWVHILIANAKRFVLGTHHGVSRKHLHRYLSEFCYRFNRRFWEAQLFDRLLTACVTCPPLRYSEVVG